MQIALVSGKDLRRSATVEPPQAIVNQAFVARYLDAGEPWAAA